MTSLLDRLVEGAGFITGLAFGTFFVRYLSYLNHHHTIAPDDPEKSQLSQNQRYRWRRPTDYDDVRPDE